MLMWYQYIRSEKMYLLSQPVESSSEVTSKNAHELYQIPRVISFCVYLGNLISTKHCHCKRLPRQCCIFKITSENLADLFPVANLLSCKLICWFNKMPFWFHITWRIRVFLQWSMKHMAGNDKMHSSERRVSTHAPTAQNFAYIAGSSVGISLFSCL